MSCARNAFRCSLVFAGLLGACGDEGPALDPDAPVHLWPVPNVGEPLVPHDASTAGDAAVHDSAVMDSAITDSAITDSAITDSGSPIHFEPPSDAAVIDAAMPPDDLDAGRSDEDAQTPAEPDSKAASFELAARFVTCFHASDLDCLREIATWSEDDLAMVPGFAAEASAKLGTRIAGTPIESSFELYDTWVYQGVTRTRYTLRSSAEYTLDPDANEMFIVIEKGNERRVESFFLISEVFND